MGVCVCVCVCVCVYGFVGGAWVGGCVCVCVCEVFMLGFPAKYVYGHCVCGAWVFVLGGGYLYQSFLQNMCMDSVCVC